MAIAQNRTRQANQVRTRAFASRVLLSLGVVSTIAYSTGCSSQSLRSGTGGETGAGGLNGTGAIGGLGAVGGRLGTGGERGLGGWEGGVGGSGVGGSGGLGGTTGCSVGVGGAAGGNSAGDAGAGADAASVCPSANDPLVQSAGHIGQPAQIGVRAFVSGVGLVFDPQATFRWTATDAPCQTGAGTLADPNLAATTFTCTALGDVTLTVHLGLVNTACDVPFSWVIHCQS
jgi:hypothetical protein